MRTQCPISLDGRNAWICVQLARRWDPQYASVEVLYIVTENTITSASPCSIASSGDRQCSTTVHILIQQNRNSDSIRNRAGKPRERRVCLGYNRIEQIDRVVSRNGL
jgi:hypothetical protein